VKLHKDWFRISEVNRRRFTDIHGDRISLLSFLLKIREAG
jgi:hypothetical protein